MKYPIRHISIRVPWHDKAWTGTVCDATIHQLQLECVSGGVFR